MTSILLISGLILAIVGIATVIVIILASERAKAVAQRDGEANARQAAESRAAVAEQEVSLLSRYRQVVDAEREAAEIRATAQAEHQRAREQVQSLLFHANRQATEAVQSSEQQAQSILAQAQAQAIGTLGASHKEAQQLLGDAKARAEATLQAAEQRHATILSEADRRAQEVAGEALRAQASLEKNRREARALQNVIEGYGDQYIVPAHSVLDDLAAEFGFAEAGANLKLARERTRQLLKEGRAATCDYVEANRRETAVNFISDAFNGKVDSVLSRVKEDNVGTLRQKILDAFALVNMNGQAFRNARITDLYLASRLDELRWAAAAQELKNREREEQRRIKERIREEERARKDYERAMREAEKEEEAIKKAMEKIQQSVAKASNEQRQRYEAQLAELQQKLTAAEEKNQRALSMAQQTKTGHVYIISNVGSFGEEVFKIGLTRRLEPLDRIRELGDASVPFEFDVHAMISSEDAPALEHALHRHFLTSQMNKVNPRKEFFRLPLATIRSEVEKLGIQASWTMTAAATEYKQSIAIDKLIRENPAQLQAWIGKQLVLDAQLGADEERELAEAS
ncbi:MAG TPA: DUF4041 domain-containing protein [Polyangiaceae bacterium]|nr:DUF4041 domain-containing protein [Polyangiaceae bacterium]